MNGFGFVSVVMGLAVCATPSFAVPPYDLQQALQTIRAVGPEGTGHVEAARAWEQVAKADADQLILVMAAMQDEETLACNWLRAAVDTIVQREEKAGRALPKEALVKLLRNTEMSARSRRTAYEILRRFVPNAEQEFMPALVNDPSLELRRDAIGLLLNDAQQLRDAGNPSAAIATYGKAFHAARDVDQIAKAFEELEKLEIKVDLARHYGFLMRWHLVAPFDNVGGKGFDVAYPPESGVDLAATYRGKEGHQVVWRLNVTDDPNGVVDINDAYKDDDDSNKDQGGNYKGAIAYAYTEFVSATDQTVDVRLGCINANQVWVNGEEILVNEVYHAGVEIDQYVVQVHFNRGPNQILVKLAQNEQTENWAQVWQFQFRICDPIGTAILSADRPLPEKTAARDRSRGITR